MPTRIPPPAAPDAPAPDAPALAAASSEARTRTLTLALPEPAPLPLVPAHLPTLAHPGDPLVAEIHDALVLLGALRRRHGLLAEAVEAAVRAVAAAVGPEMGALEDEIERLEGLLAGALAPLAREGVKTLQCRGAGEVRFRKGRPRVVFADEAAAVAELRALGAYHLVRLRESVNQRAVLEHGLPEGAAALRVEPAGVSATFHV